MSQPSLVRLGVATAMLSILATTAGCSGAGGSGGSGTAAPDGVLHYVTRTERTEPIDDPEKLYTGTTVAEEWIDVAAGMRRTDVQQTHEWGTQTRSELIRDGIRSQAETHPPTGADRDVRATFSRSDAPTEPIREPELLHTASTLDPRAMVPTVTADGTEAYLITTRTPEPGFYDSADTTLLVSAQTLAPLRSESLLLWQKPDGTWAVALREVVTYALVERVPRTEVPASVFTLSPAPGATLSAWLTLDVARARQLTDVAPVWLGETWQGMSLDPAIRYQLMPVDWGRPPGLRHGTVDADSADVHRRDLSDLTVTVEYGVPEGPDIRVISMPQVPRSRWETAFPSEYGTHSWVRVGDRDAYHVSLEYPAEPLGQAPLPNASSSLVPSRGTPDGAYRIEYVVLDVATTTVIVQGFDTAPGDVLRAAEALQPLR